MNRPQATIDWIRRELGKIGRKKVKKKGVSWKREGRYLRREIYRKACRSGGRLQDAFSGGVQKGGSIGSRRGEDNGMIPLVQRGLNVVAVQ